MPAPFSTEETPAVAATPWAVSATHTNFNQAVTSSTPLTTSNGTVGNYQANLLIADHRIHLPLPGTIRHFVLPQEPIFTFTAPTRVYMIIPTTTASTVPASTGVIAPIRAAGWVFSPMQDIFNNPFIGFDVLWGFDIFLFIGLGFKRPSLKQLLLLCLLLSLENYLCHHACICRLILNLDI